MIRSKANWRWVWVIDADVASFFDSIRPDVLASAGLRAAIPAGGTKTDLQD